MLAAKESDMPCRVTAITLRKAATGETKRLPQDWPWEDADEGDWSSLFFYREGNGGCDCNRAIWFGDATLADSLDGPCSHGKYELLKVELNDGRVFEDQEMLND